jgi:hypothetical protein
MGAWPPVSRDAAMIEPLADLAACTPHSSQSAGATPDDAAPDDDGAPGAVAPTNER